MDHEACLSELRDLAAAQLDPESNPELPEPDPDRMAELVQALDEWLAKGGFLPADWKR